MHLGKSLVGLFLDDEKGLLQIIASNIIFYVSDEFLDDVTYYVLSFSGEKNYLYYFLAILAAKDLASMILNLWFLMIFGRYVKFLYDLYKADHSEETETPTNGHCIQRIAEN
uniref:Uncharacterized protein n=1 Tax=Panagrolaimus sp. ES5 TaxID=591445 RepID=A0AC34FJ60_9BILA